MVNFGPLFAQTSSFSWEDKHFLYHIKKKNNNNATKKHQYKKDLIQLSFTNQEMVIRLIK